MLNIYRRILGYPAMKIEEGEEWKGSIRRANKDDAAALIKYFVSFSFEEAVDEDELASSKKKLQAFFDAHLESDLTFFFSEDPEGNILAMCGIQVIQMVPDAMADNNVALIYGPFNIHPDMDIYGNNIEMLADAIISFAKENNITDLITWRERAALALCVKGFGYESCHLVLSVDKLASNNYTKAAISKQLSKDMASISEKNISEFLRNRGQDTMHKKGWPLWMIK